MKVFKTELIGETLVVLPQGAAISFSYQDVHTDSNATLRLLDDASTKNVLIDLSAVEYLDSVIIGSLIRMLQKIKMRSGHAIFCSASEQMRQTLLTIKIGTLWPLFPDRDSALVAIAEPKTD